MLDIAKAAERLAEIRRLKKELEREEKSLTESLKPLISASGGRLVVGGYVLRLTQAETFQYGEVVRMIRSRHPELEAEIEELSEKFRTCYTRLNIERLS
jgi:hypothetical protein